MVDGRDSAWRSRAPGPHTNTARQAMDGLWTEVCGQQQQSNDPRNNQHNPQYANYWAPLTQKRHIPPHSAQPRHTNDWAPRTRKRHQQEHRPQRPTERSDPTQHAKGRPGDCPGPRKGATTRRNVTQGGGGGGLRGWRSGVVSPRQCVVHGCAWGVLRAPVRRQPRRIHGARAPRPRPLRNFRDCARGALSSPVFTFFWRGGAPEATAQSPSGALQPPSVTSQPPSVTSQPPSVTSQPLPVTARI